MALKLKGVMQAPVTPLKEDGSFDPEGFAKMVDFHVRHGAPAIAWPHHKAESLNLTIAERKLGAEVAVKTVAKRVPVSIFTGTLSEEDSLDIAHHAEKIGADALLIISPYCRRPSQEEIFDSVVRIGTATNLPVLTYNSPWRNGEGVEFTGELVARLIDRLPNYVGMKDASFHSQKFMEIARVALRMRPGFSIIMGVEHLLPSYALGACGSFSSSGAIAPNLCNRFFASLEAQDWATGRECQYKISRLWSLFKEQYPSSLKGAMIMMGRPVGPTRSPLPTATKERIEFLRKQLEEMGVLQSEPHGW
jgi:4-hydroxy-tetrahydrodipicolinate synthase